jgi:2-furoyl-CoA dehydrogenase large subunit
VPEPLILHQTTLSPFTPLGAKGVGEGNCMSTPVCIANAVADALGVADVTLPLSPARLAPHVHGVEAARVRGAAAAVMGARSLSGKGSVCVEASREAVWAMLLDPDALAGMIPGVHSVQRVSETQFRAEVTLGVGPVQGRYRVEVRLSDLEVPRSVTMTGTADGALGFGEARGVVTLADEGGVTRVGWRYEAAIGGKVASIGGRLLDGAARVIIGRFFAALAVRAGGGGTPRGWWRRLGGWLRGLWWRR